MNYRDEEQKHGALSELIDMVEDMPVLPSLFCILLGVGAIIYSIYIH